MSGQFLDTFLNLTLFIYVGFLIWLALRDIR
jgi:hypothetical protein